MLSFATDFPVRAGTTAACFLAVVQEWISGSPHTEFSSQALEAIKGSGRVSLDAGTESVLSLRVEQSGGSASSVRYHREDGQLHWTSLVTFSEGPELTPVVAIRVFCEAANPSVVVPSAKKPVFVRLILDRLGGGWDDRLEVGEVPLTVSAQDLPAVIAFITGKGHNRLPVVYVSSGFNGQPKVDSANLARKLAGMAHVLVEPDRHYSVALRDKVGGQNAFGGTVGIYWPGGDGRRTQIRHADYASRSALLDAVVDEVRMALVNRRPLDRCTFAAVQETLAKQEIEVLKGRESLAIDEYAKVFDGELEAQALKLADAEREIARLAAEVRMYEARHPLEDGLALSVGQERDLYPNEISAMVLRVFAEYYESTSGDTRRRDLIKAILDNNVEDEFASQAKARIKEALRGYVRMESKVKKEFEDLGFEITNQGKHPKLVFRSDDRYTFTLASSGGDSQHGGLNAASALSRLLF